MNLIIDTMPLIFSLNEAESVNGHKKLRGLFHLAETKNENGRVYPKKLLQRELKKILPAVKDRRILGEINHPDVPTIDLERASHIITDLKMDGNKVFGELETLDTPNGKLLEGLVNSSVKLGISSRGMGSLKETNEGVKVVQNDYGLITWDVVANPSTPGAWMNESAPIFIDLDENIEETDLNLIEFGTKNEKIEVDNKINIEMLIRQNISKIFGG